MATLPALQLLLRKHPLPLSTLLALSSTSPVLRPLLPRALSRSLTRLLAPYLPSSLIRPFLAHLAAARALLSGSAVLHLITQDAHWRPADLDVYAPRGTGHAVALWLVHNAGYTCTLVSRRTWRTTTPSAPADADWVTGLVTPLNDTSKGTGGGKKEEEGKVPDYFHIGADANGEYGTAAGGSHIHRVYKLRRAATTATGAATTSEGDESAIDVIEAAGASAVQPITAFHSTLVMNYISFKQVRRRTVPSFQPSTPLPSNTPIPSTPPIPSTHPTPTPLPSAQPSPSAQPAPLPSTDPPTPPPTKPRPKRPPPPITAHLSLLYPTLTLARRGVPVERAPRRRPVDSDSESDDPLAHSTVSTPDPATTAANTTPTPRETTTRRNSETTTKRNSDPPPKRDPLAKYRARGFTLEPWEGRREPWRVEGGPRSLGVGFEVGVGGGKKKKGAKKKGGKKMAEKVVEGHGDGEGGAAEDGGKGEDKAAGDDGRVEHDGRVEREAGADENAAAGDAQAGGKDDAQVASAGDAQAQSAEVEPHDATRSHDSDPSPPHDEKPDTPAPTSGADAATDASIPQADATAPQADATTLQADATSTQPDFNTTAPHPDTATSQADASTPPDNVAVPKVDATTTTSPSTPTNTVAPTTNSNASITTTTTAPTPTAPAPLSPTSTTTPSASTTTAQQTRPERTGPSRRPAPKARWRLLGW
ncbi:hypothetical protein PLICRDRAFT_38724 [Plicaturopsis crispa FD-325 SS-3]|nr:hypothetical protein PLICRDRAFT_38724 [Plicaturopsis crispa FD-325 SS-3]